MPYIAECRVLRRENDSVLVYQRLDVPLLSDRDYTQRVWQTTREGPAGTTYQFKWGPANDQGPPPKPGILRIERFDGGWLLEPNGAESTRATFFVFTDTGESLPPFIANSGSRGGVAKLFEAMRKRVKDPKYARDR